MTSIAEIIGLAPPDLKERRSEIVNRYGRRGARGQLLFCHRHGGKIEYLNATNASAANRELNALPTAKPGFVYRHGDHFHISTTPPDADR
jgi:hypothetical protein